jgi:hypothetical protein
MPEDLTTQQQAIPAPEAELLAGTERRIARAMLVLGVAGTLVCLVWGGVEWGAGFAVGAALSALNFHWMKTAATALADAATGHASQLPSGDFGSTDDEVRTYGEGAQQGDTPAPQPQRQHSRGVGVAVRFVFRYALIGLVGYAIFISSLISLGAFFLGLFLFIAAILVEIAYQVHGAFRSA